MEIPEYEIIIDDHSEEKCEYCNAKVTYECRGANEWVCEGRFCGDALEGLAEEKNDELDQIVETAEEFCEIMSEIIKDCDHIDVKVPCRITSGILVMQKYYPGANLGAAEHDLIYGPDIDQLIESKITVRDTKLLNILGWIIIDDEFIGSHI